VCEFLDKKKTLFEIQMVEAKMKEGEYESGCSSICSTKETIVQSSFEQILSSKELGACWVLNFTKSVISKMVPEVKVDFKEFLNYGIEDQNEDVWVMLGYFNQSEFVKEITIGEFMKIWPISL